MDTPTLTLEEVAELACIEAATLHDWLQLNGPFNAPSGDIEQLGPFTALAVCIAAELVRRNFLGQLLHQEAHLLIHATFDQIVCRRTTFGKRPLYFAP